MEPNLATVSEDGEDDGDENLLPIYETKTSDRVT